MDIKSTTLEESLEVTDDNGQVGAPSKDVVQHAKVSERTATDILVDAKKTVLKASRSAYKDSWSDLVA